MKRITLSLSVLMLFSLTACGLEEGVVVLGAQEEDESHLVNVYAKWPTEEFAAVEVSENIYGKNFVIAIDVSGSMDGRCDGSNKMESAKTAAIEFLSNIPADAAVGLSIFGSQVGMLVPLASNNHAAVEREIQGLSEGGGTPMSEALEASYKALSEKGSSQLSYGEYNIVILGDGEPHSVRDTKMWLDRMARETPIRVTTIGFCADVSVLDRVGINYQPASNMDELRNAFASVLAESANFVDAEF